VGGVRVLRVSGELNEQFDLSLIAAHSPARIVVFDLDGLTRVTSYGLAQWVSALDKLVAEYYCFIRVRTAIVDQFNLVRAFSQRGELISMYAPFRCPRCDAVTNLLIDLRRDFAMVESFDLPEVPCSRCKTLAQFEELPELYFQHVRSMPRPQPPVAASAVIDGKVVPASRRFQLRKEVETPVTVFWLSGVIDERRYFRRIANGVEGLVVAEFSSVEGASDDGLRGLADFLAELPQGALIGRVTAPLIEPLTRMFRRHRLPPSVRLVSTCLPFHCAACSRSTLIELNARQLRAVSSASEKAPRCSMCDERLTIDVSKEALEMVVALPFGEAPEPVDRYLRAHPEFVVATEDPMRTALANPRQFLVGKYQVLRSLGGGGMGEVFLVRHVGPEGFSKELVLKRLRRDRVEDPAAAAMLLNEARLAARLSHPNAIQVFGLERIGAEYFMVMEYLRGVDLAHALTAMEASGLTWPFEVACRVVYEICAGLQAAHTCTDDEGRPAPIVHRDVSPANVLISARGEVKLTDFGIASAEPTTMGSGFQGKPAYAAPEQLAGQSTDHRVDLYSAGVILYELVTLSRFTSTDRDRALDRTQEPAPHMATRRPDVPPRLERIYQRAVQPDPDLRYVSAAELAGDLDRIIDDLGGSRAAFASFMARVVGLCAPPEVTIESPSVTHSEDEEKDTLDRPHRRRER